MTTPTPSDAWRRLHPVTPLVRGWSVLVVLLVLVLQQREPSSTMTVLLLPALLLIGAWAYFSWTMTSYRVGEESVELRSGILSRTHRRVRLDRLQAVDVTQPLVGRIFGIAALKLEVAGGPGSNVTLAYLKDGDAQDLRRELLARAAGISVTADKAPEAPEREVLEVPVPRLLLSLLLSTSTLVFVALPVVAVTLTLTTDSGLSLAFLLPLLFGAVTTLWAQFASGFGFRAATSPDGLRLRHGLTETRAQTVPPGRVQAVRLTQPLLWRGPRWWRIEMNVAGYGVSVDQKGSETVLLPVGTAEDALTVLELLVPSLGESRSAVSSGLTGRGSGEAWVSASPASRWVSPLTYRRNGFCVTTGALLVRTGRLRRALVVVPHERTQSLGLVQGPLQRRLGLASVSAHSTPGPVHALVPDLSASDASALLEGQAARSRAARAAAGPTQWMLELSAQDERTRVVQSDLGTLTTPKEGSPDVQAAPAAPPSHLHHESH